MISTNFSNPAKAKKIIDSNYLFIKNIRDVALLSGCNYNTLRAKFWRMYGLSMESYLLSLKLSKAKKMLEKKEMLIKQVAFELGYSDEATFVRQFKKNCGLPPGVYRYKKTIVELISKTLPILRSYI